MLYIFDLGNVIVEIDFNRVLGVWSDYSRIPLATLKQRFVMAEPFFRHERGEISDQQFASALCEQMDMPLSYEQFSHGWLAIFVAVHQDVLDIMAQLRADGHRVVVLSNTNELHTEHWLQHYPQIAANADALYLSQQMGMRKPEPEIYRRLLASENTRPAQAVFFDDHPDNIQAARALGIASVQVQGSHSVTDYFTDQRNNR